MKREIYGMPVWALVFVAFMAVYTLGYMVVTNVNDYLDHRIDLSNIYTMEADVIEVDGEDVAVWLENGHVYEFQRQGLEVGYCINVMMHDNCTPDDVTDDYPLY